ncbi:SpoVG family protein [uncultured Oscillibacter sp.]|uniref:SpoVG family protein n=1 Tax=uncultured Oscillibacter sp. TaxID=876091 RepID=UPI002633519E|nr:SpoVG family protein [uncultured Oscillibacter sp.]
MAKNSAPPPAPEPQLMDIEVNIHSISTRGSVLANASVTLGGCFAVRNIKIMNSEKGPFVSMPGYRSANGFKDVCFPCTQEFHKRFQQTVLAAYRQELAQLHEPQTYERPRQRESSGFEERAAPGPAGDPEEASLDGLEEEGHSSGGMAMQ